jgi:hypothetical protein
LKNQIQKTPLTVAVSGLRAVCRGSDWSFHKEERQLEVLIQDISPKAIDRASKEEKRAPKGQEWEGEGGGGD